MAEEALNPANPVEVSVLETLQGWENLAFIRQDIFSTM